MNRREAIKAAAVGAAAVATGVALEPETARIVMTWTEYYGKVSDGEVRTYGPVKFKRGAFVFTDNTLSWEPEA